ncbi:MAG: VWA domain-containing protein [Vicinamibacterales bacterium]
MRRLAPIALACALAGMVPVAQNQLPTFSSRVEAVRVDVLVTDGGRPVPDLRAADFEVFDNGVRQTVDFASAEQLPLNVVFTFDLSGSIVGERLDNLREASHAVLDGLKEDDQAALVTFNSAVSVGPGLTRDVRLVKAAIDRAEPAGNTSLVDASFAGLMLAEADVGRGLVIVFSDGIDTSSWLQPKAVLDAARRTDAVVYAVSAGQARRAEFLGDLTEQTGGRLFRIESTRSLSEVFLEVLNEFRQRYLLSYSPAGVSPGGWHTLTVRVKDRSATVRARPGYLADGPM